MTKGFARGVLYQDGKDGFYSVILNPRLIPFIKKNSNSQNNAEKLAKYSFLKTREGFWGHLAVKDINSNIAEINGVNRKPSRFYRKESNTRRSKYMRRIAKRKEVIKRGKKSMLARREREVKRVDRLMQAARAKNLIDVADGFISY